SQRETLPRAGRIREVILFLKFLSCAGARGGGPCPQPRSPPRPGTHAPSPGAFSRAFNPAGGVPRAPSPGVERRSLGCWPRGVCVSSRFFVGGAALGPVKRVRCRAPRRGTRFLEAGRGPIANPRILARVGSARRIGRSPGRGRGRIPWA